MAFRLRWRWLSMLLCGLFIVPLGALAQSPADRAAVAPALVLVRRPPDPIADWVAGQAHLSSSAPAAGASGLNQPAGVAVGPAGRVFVVDYGNNRVLSWPSASAFQTGAAADLVLGQPDFNTTSAANTLNKMDGPEAITVAASGRVYVADSNNHRVLIFDPPLSSAMAASASFGTFVMTLPDPPPLTNQFFFPRGLALDSAGNLYLVDEFHNRVLIYLAPETTDTLPDAQIVNLFAPRGVAVDSLDNVYITDSENDQVLVYDTPVLSNDFAPDHTLGGSDGTHLECGGAVTTNNNATATTMSCPIDVAVDADDNVYVSDIYNHRVLVFDDPLNSNVPTEGIGQPDFSSSQPNRGAAASTIGLNNPLGMAIDSRGSLWLADFLNNRVLVYAARPTLTELLTSNLIANGAAETSAGASDNNSVFAPGSWAVLDGALTAVGYGVSGLPAPSDPGPPDRGVNLFAGGPNVDHTTAQQVIYVDELAAAIDAGAIRYAASGYFGGYETENDQAFLELNFQQADGTFIDQAIMGLYTATDRQNATGLLFDSASGTLPVGTRRIQVQLQMQRTAGFYNDGYADTLVLVLTGYTVQLPVLLK